MRKDSVPEADTEGIRNRREQSETTLNLVEGARLPWGSRIAMMEGSCETTLGWSGKKMRGFLVFCYVPVLEGAKSRSRKSGCKIEVRG